MPNKDTDFVDVFADSQSSFMEVIKVMRAYGIAREMSDDGKVEDANLEEFLSEGYDGLSKIWSEVSDRSMTEGTITSQSLCETYLRDIGFDEQFEDMLSSRGMHVHRRNNGEIVVYSSQEFAKEHLDFFRKLSELNEGEASSISCDPV